MVVEEKIIITCVSDYNYQEIRPESLVHLSAYLRATRPWEPPGAITSIPGASTASTPGVTASTPARSLAPQPSAFGPDISVLPPVVL